MWPRLGRASDLRRLWADPDVSQGLPCRAHPARAAKPVLSLMSSPSAGGLNPRPRDCPAVAVPQLVDGLVLCRSVCAPLRHDLAGRALVEAKLFSYRAGKKRAGTLPGAYGLFSLITATSFGMGPRCFAAVHSIVRQKGPGPGC
eukprot:2007248-Rhodomonas_salina.2